MTLATGSRLGPYEIVASLGAGGMGEVYRARDTRLGREVAVKVLPAEVATDQERLHRFEQEARAASALSHPNILTLFDVGRDGETSFLVTELLEGDSLRARLADGALPPRKAIEIGVEIARGLAAAHAKGIVHRDLKPENLFLTRDGVVKILDFGLAKLTLPESGAIAEATTVPGMTATGMVMGTAGYMAPEQVRGESADARSDLFALGCVLYELVSGRRAFAGNTAPETLSAILRDEPAPLAAPGPTGSVLEGIVRRCLEKRPEDRFQSARDLGFALEAVAHPGSGSGVSVAHPQRSAPARRARAGIALGAVVGLALGAAGAWLASRRPAPASGPPSFQRITFQRGNILHGRFAPDGQSVVYSASWEGRPTEIFTVRIDGPESRPLGLPKSDLQAVSRSGELLILRKQSGLTTTSFGLGTLARSSLSGGAPRDLLEAVRSADWLDDERIVVSRNRGVGHDVLELPLGTPVLENPSSPPRVSHDQSLVAVFRASQAGSELVVLDSAGKVEWSLQSAPSDLVAWHPNGEIWFGAAFGSNAGLFAVRPGGSRRLVLHGPGWLIHDISADGRALLERGILRLGVRFHGAGDAAERELSWLDGSSLRGMSSDGRSLLLSERGDGGGARGGVYLRSSDGAPAVRLADGNALALSEDGRWVLTRAPGEPARHWLVPAGAGEPRALDLGDDEVLAAVALPGPEPRFVVTVRTPTGAVHVEQIGAAGRTGLPLESGFFSTSAAISPDGRRIAYNPRGGRFGEIRLCELSSGVCQTPLAVGADSAVVQWSADGRSLWLRDWGEPRIRLSRLDLETGARETWLELGADDEANVISLNNLYLSRDGRIYAFGRSVVEESSLFVVDGLR
jgi:hypothetical protein